MIDDFSSVSQVESGYILANNVRSEITREKLKYMLTKYNCFPADYRKSIWAYILRLPRNEEAFKSLCLKAQLPQARKLCAQKQCRPKTLIIFNALIHWHAPLINCDWLPPFVDKVVALFGRDQLFCFEVVATFLTVYFSEWLSHVPGPPPEVISRIDAILAHRNAELREALGTGFAAWPVYKSCFAEILYDQSWFDLMDVVFSSNPQFIEFLVVAWLEVNSSQLKLDHETFHSTRRPVNFRKLVDCAKDIWKNTPDSLFVKLRFSPLTRPHYPLIETNADAVVLRTLQSDHDKLASLQKQLTEERIAVDEAEKVKTRKMQIIEAIHKLHRQKEEEEKIETAKAAVSLDNQMKQIRLEGKRLKLTDERQFMEQWIHDWSNNIDMTSRSMRNAFGGEHSELKVEDDDLTRIQALTNMRQADSMSREARRISVARAKQARGELDAHAHQRALHSEVMRLANNPDLLMTSSKLKKVSQIE